MKLSCLLTLLLVGALHFSCDRSQDAPPLGEASDDRTLDPTAVKTHSVEIVTDPETIPSASENVASTSLPLFYSEGDTFQGMWNYNRRNFNLRMTVVEVNPDNRTIRVTMKSDDLDGAEKEMTGNLLPDGRQVNLKGISGTGSDPALAAAVSGYHVIDLLKKSSTQGISLNDCSTRQLRGETDDGTNVYFWTKLKKNVTASR